MPPDRSSPRRLGVRLLAALTQARLDLRMVTGGRAFVLLVVVGLWFGLFATWAVFRDDPWSPAAYYNLMLVIPGTLLVVALGMISVIGERDAGRLETLFVTPSGRYSFWAQRLGAILLACWASTGLLSVLTWWIVDPGHEPFAAWLHAVVPLSFALGLTVFFSLLFKSAAVGGLCSGALLVVFGLFHGDGSGRWDYWFSPFGARDRIDDPEELLRLVVFNRSVLLVLTALLVGLAFALLQRRERLL